MRRITSESIFRAFRIVLAFVVVAHIALPIVGPQAEVRPLYSSRIPTLEESFKNADIVAAVYVGAATQVFVHGEICGTKYRGIAKSVFKGRAKLKSKDKEIFFGRGSGLDVGNEYLLFMTHVSSWEGDYERILKDFPQILLSKPKDEAIEMINCGGLVPGFYYDSKTPWRIIGDEVTIFAVWRKSEIPAAIQVIYQDGPLRVFTKRSVFRYLDALKSRKGTEDTILNYPGRER